MPAKGRLKASADTFMITRVFDAPRDLVWRAWSDAEQLQTWWGPKGCTIKVATFEFRPGGFFHYAMDFADSSMWGRFIYRDIETGTRIAWLNSFSNEGCGIARAPFDATIPLEILNDVTFAETAGKTTLTLHARPHGASDAETKTFEGMFPSLNEGYGGTFDRLASALSRI